MDFGVGYFPTHDGMRPGEIARRVEERGQNALYDIGGGGPTVIDRVLAYADGWFPQWHDKDLVPRIGELRAKAGRHVPVQVLSVPPDPAALEQLAAAGADRVSCWLPSGPWSKVEPALQKWESAIGELVGR